MHLRKICLLVILISLCLVPTWGTFASARPDLGPNDLEAARSASRESLEYAGTPAYDSGWEPFGVRPDPIAVEFTHNLGGDPDTYRVSLECRDDSELGTYDCTNRGFDVTAHWYGLTNSVVQVYVVAGSLPDAVRVRIYTETPAYDSGWESLGVRPDPIPVPFTHNLGRDPNDYIVSLECRDDTSLGTYDCTDQNFNVNALWYDLTNSGVQVYVVGGSLPDDVRVRIYLGPPMYDSGWQALGVRPDPLPVPFAHNLGGDPDDYLVDLECRDSKTSLHTYGCTNLGFNVNALWYDLTDSTITVYVVGGSQPEDIRVRIWAVQNIYLPVVIRS
jgi:hypothetical protein